MWQCGQCGTQNDEREPMCIYCGYANADCKPSFGEKLFIFLSQKKPPDIYKPFEITKRSGVIKTVYHSAQAFVLIIFIAFIYLQNGSGLFDEIAYRIEKRWLVVADGVSTAARERLTYNARQADGYNERMLTALDKGADIVTRVESAWKTDIEGKVGYIVNERVSDLQRRVTEIIEYIRGMF
jgi:hypothetical protein